MWSAIWRSTVIKKLFFLLLILFISTPVWAKAFRVVSPSPFGPISTRTQNPLYLLFYGETNESARTLPKNRFQITADTAFANLFEYAPRAAGIGLNLDMENWRGTLGVRYGLSQKMELGLSLPFQGMSGGFLDSFIQSYHHAFGFPNGGRQFVANGVYSFRVTKNGATLFQAPAGDGVGDLSLSAKLKLTEEGIYLPGLALKTSLKLPTGSSSAGLGSGRPDGAMTLYAQKSFGRFHSYTQFGFVASGGSQSLDSILHPFMVTFGEALEFNLTNHLSTLVQINTNSPLFHGTGLTQLDHAPLDLIVGVRGRYLPKNGLHKIFYQVSFTEDPMANDPSVDIAVNWSLGVEFN